MNAKAKAPAAAADAGAAGGGKKKIMIIVIAVLLAVGLGGGAAWFFTRGGDDGEHATETKSKKKKKEASGPPVYVQIDQFTVNLQPEEGEHYLQLKFTLQVEGEEQKKLIEENMAKVRNRVLLLLSGKKASEINTPDGKQVLAKEITDTINEPFESKGDPQEVAEVLFTDFIIQ
jgi:flagellar FliL protein